MTAGHDRLAITFLGTRDAAVAPGTFTSSQLLRLGESLVLVDCGLGSASQLWRDGVEARDLDLILLTHWHPDHVAGLPNILRRAGHRARSKPLRLAGPRPPRREWWHALRTLSLRRLVSSLDVVEAGEVLELPGWRLEALHTEHGTPSLGWRVDEASGGRKLVLSGDTRPIRSVRDAASGASLLVHEATFLERDRTKAESSSHSTAREAGALAAAAGCAALALTHLPLRYTREEIRREAESAFQPVYLPDDLDRIEIGPDALEHVPAPRGVPAAPMGG